jgi:C4-dicarboxylate transporter, DctM subunit
MEAWLIPFILVLMCLLLIAGLPIPFCLGLSGLIGAMIGFHGNLYAIKTLMWNKLDDFVIAVIIFFLIMGELLSESELSSDMYEGANRWLGPFPGGILHTNVIAATIFAACTGVSGASAAVLGKIAYNAGNKLGYSIKLNMGSIAAGASLAILIPPSVIMILYGVVAEVSIGTLFIAGVIPGLCTSGLFMLYIAFHSWRHPSEAPRGKGYDFREKLAGLRMMLPVLALMAVVLGSMYGGFTTATEAGAMGAVFALVIGLIYRRLDWPKIRRALMNTARVTSMVMFLIIGATSISGVLAHSGLSMRIVEFITSSGISWGWFYLIICVLYIILGCFFDSYSILLLTLPFIYPVIKELGVNGVLFGVMVTILIETGLITPPFGINLFILDGVVGGGHMHEIIAGMVPFLLILFFMLGVLFFFPELALWLPSTMFGRAG